MHVTIYKKRIDYKLITNLFKIKIVSCENFAYLFVCVCSKFILYIYDKIFNRMKVPKKSGGFQSMALSFPVLKGILKRGYKIPTPIQRKVCY